MALWFSKSYEILSLATNIKIENSTYQSIIKYSSSSFCFWKKKNILITMAETLILSYRKEGHRVSLLKQSRTAIHSCPEAKHPSGGWKQRANAKSTGRIIGQGSGEWTSLSTCWSCKKEKQFGNKTFTNIE